MAKANPQRAAVEQAFAEASRAASRLSFLGALGFGLALIIGMTLAKEGGFLAAGFGLQMILFAGGIGGGIVFTVLALRAARMAKQAKRRLDGR